jgi:hypothetical protein
MTGKEFLNAIANGKSDILQTILNMISDTGATYCVIGGLAVNAYVEPVVSLDLDIVIALSNLENMMDAAKRNGLKVESFEHIVNISSQDSDLRIQIQTDPRYQDFIQRAQPVDTLGYNMKLAVLEDVLQGKMWAYMDKIRLRSKRQKDLADMLRLIESYPRLSAFLPPELQEELESK